MQTFFYLLAGFLFFCWLVSLSNSFTHLRQARRLIREMNEISRKFETTPWHPSKQPEFAAMDASFWSTSDQAEMHIRDASHANDKTMKFAVGALVSALTGLLIGVV